MDNDNAVLVYLNITTWQANRQDRLVADQVAEDYAVQDKNMGRFWKSLLPKCPELQALHAAQRAARSHHYANTIAWLHDGVRVLPTANYTHYMTEAKRLRDVFQTAVLDLAARYPSIKEMAKASLGNLYNEDDYPPADTLAARYSFDIKVLAMPDSAHLKRLGLADSESAELAEKLEADVREAFQAANKKFYVDIIERLEKFTSVLSNPSANVREESIRGVQKLAEILPRLNITNDATLATMSQNLQATLKGVSSAAMATNPVARARVQAETSTVLKAAVAIMARRRTAAAKNEVLKRAA